MFTNTKQIACTLRKSVIDSFMPKAKQTKEGLTMKINNVEIKDKYFAFDTCHKIYILSNQDEMYQAIKLGYEIKETKDIVNTYNKSCSLKFIDFWNVEKKHIRIVKQENGNRLYKETNKKAYNTKY